MKASAGMKRTSATNSASAGYCFIASDATMPICMSEQILALPEDKRSDIKNLRPGIPLFCYNFTSKKLYGGMEAVTDCSQKLVTMGELANFPLQVRFKITKVCKPLDLDPKIRDYFMVIGPPRKNSVSQSATVARYIVRHRLSASDVASLNALFFPDTHADKRHGSVRGIRSTSTVSAPRKVVKAPVAPQSTLGGWASLLKKPARATSPPEGSAGAKAGGSPTITSPVGSGGGDDSSSCGGSVSGNSLSAHTGESTNTGGAAACAAEEDSSPSPAEAAGAEAASRSPQLDAAQAPPPPPPPPPPPSSVERGGGAAVMGGASAGSADACVAAGDACAAPAQRPDAAAEKGGGRPPLAPTSRSKEAPTPSSSSTARGHLGLAKAMRSFLKAVDAEWNGGVMDDAVCRGRRFTPPSSHKDGNNWNRADVKAALMLVKDAIHKLWGQKVEVDMYGSVSTNTWLPGQSDLDLLLRLPANELVHPGYASEYATATREGSADAADTDAGAASEAASALADLRTPPPKRRPEGGGGGGVTETPRPVIAASPWDRLVKKLLGSGTLRQMAPGMSYDIKCAEREHSLVFLRVLNDHLVGRPEHASWVKGVKLVSGSMPVLKLTVNGRVPVDLSWHTSEHMGLEAKKFVTTCIQSLQGVLRPMVLVLKRLLHVRGLSNVYQGGLGAYTLTLLVAFYLRRLSLHFSNTNNGAAANAAMPEPLTGVRPAASLSFDTANLDPCLSAAAAAARSLAPPPPPPIAWSRVHHTSAARIGGGVADQRQLEALYRKESELVLRAEATIASAVRLARPPRPNDRAAADAADAASDRKATRDSGAHGRARFTFRSRRSEIDIGLALLGFLRLFSPPNRGGLDLAQIGLSFSKDGDGCPVFCHRMGGTPLVITDPNVPHVRLGGGSYALASVQAYFAEIADALTAPQVGTNTTAAAAAVAAESASCDTAVVQGERLCEFLQWTRPAASEAGAPPTAAAAAAEAARPSHGDGAATTTDANMAKKKQLTVTQSAPATVPADSERAPSSPAAKPEVAQGALAVAAAATAAAADEFVFGTETPESTPESSERRKVAQGEGEEQKAAAPTAALESPPADSAKVSPSAAAAAKPRSWSQIASPVRAAADDGTRAQQWRRSPRASVGGSEQRRRRRQTEGVASPPAPRGRGAVGKRLEEAFAESSFAPPAGGASSQHQQNGAAAAKSAASAGGATGTQAGGQPHAGAGAAGRGASKAFQQARTRVIVSNLNHERSTKAEYEAEVRKLVDKFKSFGPCRFEYTKYESKMGVFWVTYETRAVAKRAMKAMQGGQFRGANFFCNFSPAVTKS